MPASRNPKLIAQWLINPEAAAFDCRLALANNDGKVYAAAKELRVSPRSLYTWMKKYPQLFKG